MLLLPVKRVTMVEKISDIAAVHGIDVKEFVKELNKAMNNN